MKEKKFRYVSTIFSSLPEVLKKPLILVPFLIGAIIAMIYTIITSDINQKLNSPLPNMNLVFVSLLVLILYIVIQMLIGSTALASVRLFTDGKKLSITKQLNGGLLLFWKYVGLSIFKAVIILIPVAILSLIAFVIVFTASKNTGITSPEVGAPLLILFLLAVVIILFLGLILMFADVVITEGKKIFEAIKESYKIFRHHFGHSFKTMLSLMLFMLVYLGILVAIIGLIFGFDSISGQNQTGKELPGILMNLFGIPASATALVYIFKSRKHSLILMKKKK